MGDAAPQRMERRQKRLARGLALLATLALPLALIGCGGATTSGRSATGYPTLPVPTATASPPPTATPVGVAWTQVSAGSPDASGAPAILRTRYDVYSGQDSKTSPAYFRLRRSDDFGKTWVNLTPPQIPGVSYPANVSDVLGNMSPLNAQVYFLTLQLINVACPVPQSATSQSACQAQYVTMDGGATWRLLALPAPGVLGVSGPFVNSANIHAQGSRLYGVINDTLLASSGNIPPGRLVISDDGGASWRLADGALAAHGLLVYNYAVSPSGSSVFALVGVTNRDLTPGGLPPLTFWHSQDAGATWLETQPLPAKDEGPMLATSDTSGQTRLYLVAGDSYDAMRLFASPDNGVRWTECGEQFSDAPALLGALPSGAILLDTPGAVEEWGGDTQAPRVIAPPSGLSGAELAALQRQPDGSTRLWLVGYSSQGTAYEYTTVKLT